MTTLHRYYLGFIFSLVLTLCSVGALKLHEATGHDTLSHGVLAAIFVLFALLQLLTQLYFFMHLGRERRMRSNSVLFGLTAIIIVILVGGTLWIMSHLDSQHTMLHEDSVISPRNEIP